MKQPKRWPIWKIAVTVAVLAAAAVVLLWLSAFLEQTGGERPTDPSRTRTAVFTLPRFLMIIGVGMGALCAASIGWLAFRIREARKPVWERRGGKRR